MAFTFHDLKCIIEVYLDDLAAHSHLRVDHPDHLIVFGRCRRYQIWLNPQKCIFCVKVCCLLGFIISKEWIRVEHLNIEEIL